MNVAEPTLTQVDQSIIAQQEFEALMDRMILEGIAYPAILGGLAMAVIRSLSLSAGPEAVSPWFAENARLTHNLGGGEIDKPKPN
jgi:hypothetical protein